MSLDQSIRPLLVSLALPALTCVLQSPLVQPLLRILWRTTTNLRISPWLWQQLSSLWARFKRDRTQRLLLSVGVVMVVVLNLIDHYVLPKGLGEAAAAPAEGELARLSHGKTYYRLYGCPPSRASKLLVLCHGMSTPSIVFHPLTTLLKNDRRLSDYAILVYDHYGRGYSDKPDVPNTMQLFVSQLAELLFHLGQDRSFPAAKKPIALVGYSMGGSVVTGFAHTYPSKIERLVLLASAGHITLPRQLSLMAATPGLRVLFARYVLLNNYREDMLGATARVGGEAGPLVMTYWDHQIRTPHYCRALLSTLIHFQELFDNTTTLRAMGEQARQSSRAYPVLALWGGEDKVVLPAAAEVFVRLLGGGGAREVASHVLKGRDHSFPLEHPKEVVSHLAMFL